MSKRLFYSLIILLEILFSFIIFNFNIPCLIKLIIKIPCPACGLTRAFKSLLQLNIIDAIKYNFLVIPISIFVIIVNYYIIKDIILNKDETKLFVNKVLSHYKIIILLLIISEIVNMIKEII